MRNLIDFLVKYSTAMLFMLLVLLSCILLFTGNTYQQSVYLTSANAFAGSIFEVGQSVTGYFNLRNINQDLQQRNASLENEVLNLKNEIAYLKTIVPLDSATEARIPSARFDFVMATVINNSTHRPRNFFTINRGSADGIMPGMGVVDQNGIVGIVNVTGKKSARIISVLNETQRFSVKVKGSNYVGSLSWKEGNPAIAYVEELPRHVKYNVGDTIVTSGYSTTFPEGIPVGFVMGQVHTTDDNFYTLKVHLAADFSQLSTVRVIRDEFKAEMDSLNLFDQRTEASKNK